LGALGKERQTLTLFRQMLRLKRSRIAVALLGGIVLIAVVGPYIAPFDPNSFVGPPFLAAYEGSPFGTDLLGRDVLSRFLSGGLSILGIALAATLLGVGVGTLIGITAAYVRSSLGDFLMRANDVLLAFPMIVFALLLISTIGPKPWLLILTVALGTAPRVARLARSAALEIVDREFIKISEAFGESSAAILLRELLPNIASPLLVETSLRLTYSIGVVASLSYLGFGVQPPDPDWGRMISENQSALSIQPWPVVLPVLAIAVLTIGTNLLADGFLRALIGIERGQDRPA
jgi:peptide/nickel transport system permease protein